MAKQCTLPKLNYTGERFLPNLVLISACTLHYDAISTPCKTGLQRRTFNISLSSQTIFVKSERYFMNTFYLLHRQKYIRFKITKGNSEDLKYLHHSIHLIKYIWLTLHGLPFRSFSVIALVPFACFYASCYPMLIATIFNSADGFEYV